MGIFGYFWVRRLIMLSFWRGGQGFRISSLVSQREGRRTTKREARRSLNLIAVTNVEHLIQLLDGIALVV